MKYATIIHTATSLDEVVEYINENLDEASEIAAQYALQATDEAARDWDRVDFAGVEGCIVAMLEFLADSGAEFNSSEAMDIASTYSPGIDFGAVEV